MSERSVISTMSVMIYDVGDKDLVLGLGLGFKLRLPVHLSGHDRQCGLCQHLLL